MRLPGRAARSRSVPPRPAGAQPSAGPSPRPPSARQSTRGGPDSPGGTRPRGRRSCCGPPIPLPGAEMVDRQQDAARGPVDDLRGVGQSRVEQAGHQRDVQQAAAFDARQDQHQSSIEPFRFQPLDPSPAAKPPDRQDEEAQGADQAAPEATPAPVRGRVGRCGMFHGWHLLGVHGPSRSDAMMRHSFRATGRRRPIRPLTDERWFRATGRASSYTPADRRKVDRGIRSGRRAFTPVFGFSR